MSSRQAATPARTAELIRRELGRRGVELVPLGELLAALGVAEQALRAAVDQSLDLGIGGPARRPVVWRVNPAPLAAGFEPVYDGERLTLALAGAGPAGASLVLSGRHLDPATAAPAAGELAYALARLEAMSDRWLAGNHRLFSLISQAWQAESASVRSSGRLSVRCADLGEPIAAMFWLDNAPACRLELVVWADRQDGLVLINVYPCDTDHSIPDSED